MPMILSRLARHRGVRYGAAAIAATGLLATLHAQMRSGSVKVAMNAVAPRPTPLTIGVGVHFGIGGEYNYRPGPSADAMGAIGVSSWRDDVPWGSFKSAGPDKPGQVQPKLQAMLNATPLRPLLILGHANPAVQGGDAPVDPASLGAYGSFVREAVGDLQSHNPIYEVWNEWNRTAAEKMPLLKDAGRPGDPRAAVNYARLAGAATRQIRAVDPKATILVGAAATDPGWSWVQGIVADGAMRQADGVSIHYYNHCDRAPLRTAAEAIGAIQSLHDKLAARTKGKVPPIYVTEIGWPTTTGGGCDISRSASSDNITQFLLWAAATPWLKGVWIYQLKDQGQRPNEIEDNFGLFDYNYQPKPAACSVKDVTKLVKIATGWSVQRPTPGVVMLQVKTSAGPKLVAWTEEQGMKAQLSIKGGRSAGYRLFCDATTQSSATIPIGTRPTLIDASTLDGTTIDVARQ